MNSIGAGVTGAVQEHRVHANGAEICYFEWGRASSDHPTWLFCHATGFHARCWDQVVAGLPDGAHAVAMDMRGHGRSSKTPPFNWQSFGGDTAGLIEILDLQRIIGVGHSMGGHALTQAAARFSERFDRLVLVDPVIFDPSIKTRPARHEFDDPSEHPVARRKARFDSWQAMYERFAERMPYSLWRSEILQDYCHYGVLPLEDSSGFTLACPPVVEASIYMGSLQYDLHSLLSEVLVPVLVLRAKGPEEGAEELDFTTSPTWAGLADALPQGIDIYLPELTHFIAMQAPELVTRCAVEPVSDRRQLEDLLEEFQR